MSGRHPGGASGDRFLFQQLDLNDAAALGVAEKQMGIKKFVSGDHGTDRIQSDRLDGGVDPANDFFVVQLY